MWPISLLRCLKSDSSGTQRQRGRRLGRHPRPGFVPRLEALEDRTVPSTFTVGTLADSGPESLRQAILDANAQPGDDTINFSVTGIIQLAGELPSLSSNIDIQGPGASDLTVRGATGGSYRIFTVAGTATVSISGLTISNGVGGILNHGTLTVSNCTISGNIALDGGGILNFGTLTVSNSTLSGNAAFSVCSGDVCYGGSGGGIANASGFTNVGRLTVSNSTISGNGADYGGGIANVGTLTVSNSTLSGNTAYEGGGIHNAHAGFTNSGRLTVSNSTLSGNTAILAGGGIFRGGGTVNLRNTILAGNTALSVPDLAGTLASSGYNLIGNTNGGSGYAPTDLLNVDPLLGPLADNGAPTWTHALLPGSPALDAGDNTDAPEFDQRGPGFPRIVNGTIDIGAFEAQPTNRPPVLDPVADRAIPAGELLLLVPLAATDPDGDALTFAAEAVPVAFLLDRDLGLAAYLPEWDDWGGRGEKWLLAEDGQWYFLLASGELYRWDGGGQATGEPVGVPGASYYADPDLLADARPDRLFAALTIDGDSLIIEREADTASSLFVTVLVSDGLLEARTTFTITVTA